MWIERRIHDCVELRIGVEPVNHVGDWCERRPHGCFQFIKWLHGHSSSIASSSCPSIYHTRQPRSVAHLFTADSLLVIGLPNRVSVPGGPLETWTPVRDW